MKSPLRKRLLRELKSEFGKYLVVANQDGSHNWKEKMKLDDFMLGTEVLFTAISTFDK